MRIRPISPDFGTQVDGLDLRADLDTETRDELRALFDERGVLVFHDEDLDYESQDRISRLVIGDDGPGGPLVPRFISNSGDPEALAPYGRLLFHCDMMWSPTPFQVISLYASEVGSGAARTSLVSAVRAWETLPDDLRTRVQGLHAEHSTGQVYSRGGEDLLKPEFEHGRSTIMPIAFRHPRTARTVLHVSQQMTTRIVELPADESEQLLQELFGHLYDPAVVYEHEWRDGDLVVFDNLAVQHARGNVEPDGPARTLRKVFAPMPVQASEKPSYAGASAR